MNIGAAATRSGIPAKMIRYYETVRLLNPAGRAANGYRDYSDRDIEILRFVQRSRSLGFAVKDIGGLLALWRDRSRASSDVKAIARGHIDEIDKKLTELRSIRATLEHLVMCCHGDNRPDCPIIDELARPAVKTGKGPAALAESRLRRHRS